MEKQEFGIFGIREDVGGKTAFIKTHGVCKGKDKGLWTNKY